MCAIARCYREGKGVDFSLALCEKRLRAAAEGGDTFAQSLLARQYGSVGGAAADKAQWGAVVPRRSAHKAHVYSKCPWYTFAQKPLCDALTPSLSRQREFGSHEWGRGAPNRCQPPRWPAR